MNGNSEARSAAGMRTFIVAVVVVILVIVIQYFVVMKPCINRLDTIAENTNPYGYQPPYFSKLRILNGSERRAEIHSVKVSRVPDDPPVYEEVLPEIQPQLQPWALDPESTYTSHDNGSGEAVYSVKIEGRVGPMPFTREVTHAANGLGAWEDTIVTLVVGSEADQHRVGLCVEQNFDPATGRPAIVAWDLTD